MCDVINNEIILICALFISNLFCVQNSKNESFKFFLDMTFIMFAIIVWG